jgi:hypothetical protein
MSTERKHQSETQLDSKEEKTGLSPSASSPSLSSSVDSKPILALSSSDSRDGNINVFGLFVFFYP